MFHKNPFSGSRAVSYRRTDKTKLAVAFRNVANAPKSNVVPEGIRGTGVIAPLTLNSALERRVVSTLALEKERAVTTEYEAGRNPEQIWTFCYRQ
jgi:hypothetical protein